MFGWLKKLFGAEPAAPEEWTPAPDPGPLAESTNLDDLIEEKDK